MFCYIPVSTMSDLKACRGCLSITGNLEKLSSALQRAFKTMTGLEINSADLYPEYFCGECRVQIRKAMTFRRKSRRAYYVLKEIMAVKKEVTMKEISIVDRARTNLESSIGYWNQTNCGFYTVDDSDGKNVNAMSSYVPSVDNFTCHVTNIEPTISYEEYTEEAEDTNEQVEELDETEETDGQNIDGHNIDMNDVFKGLNDDKLDDDDDDYGVKEPEINVVQQKKVSIPGIYTIKTNRLTVIVKGLYHSEVKILSEEEQSEVYKERMQLEPFSSATYKCAMCLSTYTILSDLVAHIKAHNKYTTGKEICKICKLKFSDKETLDKHTAHYHLYEYQCQICDELIYTLPQLCRHFLRDDHKRAKLNHTMRKYTMYKNFFIESLPQELMYKTILEPTGSGPKRCEICNICYSTNVRLAKHMARHEKSNSMSQYQCEICHIWFKFYSSVNKHMDYWHRFTYTCLKCETVVYNRMQAFAHMETHKLEMEEELLMCAYCGKTFKNKQDLDYHTYLKHDDRIPLEHCNLCGMSYPKRTSLYNHQLKIHGYISLPEAQVGSAEYFCNKCNVQFLTEKAYHTHIVRSQHDEAKNLENACLNCKRVFDSKDLYNSHLPCSNYKNAIYPAKCCYCETVLESSTEYKEHYVKEHPTLQYRHVRGSILCELCGKAVSRTGKKAHRCESSQYDCKFCSTQMSNATSHVVHVVSNHTRKPYYCEICWKKYKFRSDCKDHIMKMHAPGKYYWCEFCGKDFSHFDYLKQHTTRVHEINLSKSRTTYPKNKLHLFPNMKIDGRLIDEKILDEVEGVLLDLAGENGQIIENCKDYFIVGSANIEELEMIFQRHAAKRKRYQPSGPKKKKQRVINMEGDIDETNNITFESVIDTTGQEEITLGESQGELLVDESKLLVIEKEGEKYIVLNGQLYKVEE